MDIDTKKALIESERFNDKIIQTSINGIYIYDLNKQNNTFINPAYTQILGYTLEEINLMGLKFLDLFHPEDLKSIEKHMEDISKAKDNRHLKIEYRFKSKNNGYRWLLSNDNVFERDKNGKVTKFMGSFLDITEKKISEETLRESEEKHKALYQNAIVGLFRIPLDGEKPVAANKVAADIFGYSSIKDFIENFSSEKHYVNLKDRDPIIKELQEKGYINKIEIYSKKVDGSKIWNEGSFRIVREGGKVYVECVAVDITEQKQAEEDLKESEKRYRTYIENSPTGIFIVNERGEYIDANPQACKLLDYTKQELSKLSIKDIAHPEQSEKSKGSFQRLKKEKSISEEVIMKKKDGSKVYVILDAVALKNTTYIAFCTDITEKKKAEEDLKESEKKLNAFFEESSNAIGVSKYGSHIMVNPSYIKLFGYTNKSEIIGKPITDLIAPSERDKIISNVEKRKKKIKVPDNYETKGLKKDGTEFDMLVSISYYQINNDVYTAVILKDITEKKKAKEKIKMKNAEIRKGKEYLQNVINSASDIIFSIDDKGKIISWNPAAEFITGYKTWEVHKKNIEELELFENWDEINQILSEVQVEDTRVECNLIPKNGRKRKISFSISSLEPHDSGEFSFIGTDITPKIPLTIEFGKSYLLTDKSDSKIIFLSLLKSETKGVFISREIPNLIEDSIKNGEVTPLLLKEDIYENKNSLEDLFKKIKTLISGQTSHVLFLDRADYIITLFGYKNFLKFLYALNDIIRDSKSSLILDLKSGIIQESEKVFLQQELSTFPDYSEEIQEIYQDLQEIIILINKNRLRNITITFKEIRKELNISSVTTRKRITELVERGFVEIVKIGRSKNLTLTQKALNFLEG